MNKFWGPFEKFIIGLLAVLFGIYFALDHYSPEMLYSELKNLHHDPSILSNSAPREGEVIPTSLYGAYISNPSMFLTRDEFGKKAEDIQFNPKNINFFAKGTDGQEHPANAYFLKFTPFDTKKYWLPLLAVSLRVKYMRDNEFNLKEDIWQTSLETYVRMRGDCEDHAILLADWMIGLGYDARVVGGTFNGEGHAWVILYMDGKEYLLEATDKASRRRYPLVELHPEYAALFMFNQNRFWVKKTQNLNRYEPEQWILLSEFREKIF